MLSFYPLASRDFDALTSPDAAVTRDELAAYGEALQRSLGVPRLNHERETDSPGVGLDGLRRRCHLVSPWTRSQVRVMRAWASGSKWVDGSADWYATIDDEIHGREWRKPTRMPKVVDPASIGETLDSAALLARGDLSDDGARAGELGIPSAQSRADAAEARPGSDWLRANAPAVKPGPKRASEDEGHAWALQDAFRRDGLDMAAFKVASAKGGRQTPERQRIRRDGLRTIASMCPSRVPVQAAADMLGTHSVSLTRALGPYRERLS